LIEQAIELAEDVDGVFDGPRVYDDAFSSTLKYALMVSVGWRPRVR
jgi:hypothetical protein